MNWDLLFPQSGDPGDAGSCSGPGEPPARPALYQSPWMRLLSAVYRPALLLFHREAGEPAPGRGGGLLGPLLDKMRGGPGSSLWTAAAAWPWAPAAEKQPQEEEEPPQVSPLQTPASPSLLLLGRAWGPVHQPVLCHPLEVLERPGVTLQQRVRKSLGPQLPLCATQRMEKLPECSQRCGQVILDQDYGYSSLEEEHTVSLHHYSDCWGTQLPPELAPTFPEGSGPKDIKETHVENEEAVLHLDSAMPKFDIENGSASLQDDEWSSSESTSDESEDDAEEEEDYYSIPRPQCSNKTIGYILGNITSSSDDSEEDEDSDSDDGFDSDDSYELSDTDEELLNSLAGTSDPYNLMNFQACIKTQQNLDTRPALESSCPQQSVVCTLVLDGDDSDRLDSGFSDEVQGELQKAFAQLASGKKCSKKVAFDEQVTVHYVSSEEIRKGPWEEYARDRCRFQKRIREIEESIGYCFTPKHRWNVLEKLQLGS